MINDETTVTYPLPPVQRLGLALGPNAAASGAGVLARAWYSVRRSLDSWVDFGRYQLLIWCWWIALCQAATVPL